MCEACQLQLCSQHTQYYLNRAHIVCCIVAVIVNDGSRITVRSVAKGNKYREANGNSQGCLHMRVYTCLLSRTTHASWLYTTKRERRRVNCILANSG